MSEEAPKLAAFDLFAPGDIVTVFRRGKRRYRAVVGDVINADYSRITVRPLPGEGESDRARQVAFGSLLPPTLQNSHFEE